jgi:hypothetical protein
MMLVGILTQKDTRNDGKPVFLAGIDQFVVPTLKERRLAAVPVVTARVERRTHCVDQMVASPLRITEAETVVGLTLPAATIPISKIRPFMHRFQARACSLS